MNASAYFLLAASLCVLGGGCASDGIPVHYIEIRAAQAKTESSAHGGLSAAVATNLFNDVASRLASLGRANSPHHYNPYPAKPGYVEYVVSFIPEGGYSVALYMDIDGSHITFRGEADTDPKTVAALEEAMKLIRESLDERLVKYEVQTFTTRLYAIPS